MDGATVIVTSFPPLKQDAILCYPGETLQEKSPCELTRKGLISLAPRDGLEPPT